MIQQNDEEISFKEIVNKILKNKKILIIFVAISTLVMSVYIYSPFFQRKVSYTATSSMSIVYNYKAPQNPENIGEGYVYYQDRLHGVMIPTIKGYAQSLSILRSIINELEIKNSHGNYLSARELAKNIEIENQLDSNLIVINVKYNDSKVAEEIANKIPEKLMQMANANEKLSNYEINIVDYAIALESDTLGGLTLVFISIFLATFIGICYIFLKDYFSNKINSLHTLNKMGLDVEIITKNSINLRKIISLSKLSNSKNILICTEEAEEISNIREEIEEYLKEDMIINVLSYKDSEFLIKCRDYDKVFIVIRESKTNIKDLEEIAMLSKKYNIFISVIYIER